MRNVTIFILETNLCQLNMIISLKMIAIWTLGILSHFLHFYTSGSREVVLTSFPKSCCFLFFLGHVSSVWLFSCCLNSLSFCEIRYTWPKTYSYYRYKTKLILVNPWRHMVKNSIDSMIDVSYIWRSFSIPLFIIFP